MPHFRTLLAHMGLAERRRERRLDSRGLTVSYAAKPEQKRVKIGNISPIGLYLVTEDRWRPGTTVLLTLGEKNIVDDTHRSQVRLWTRCVRADQAGAGLIFAHSHLDPGKWLEAMSSAPSLIAENRAVHLFRFTRALAFLSHIAPTAENDILDLITNYLGREGTERAIEVALFADDLLEAQNCPSRRNIPPSLVLRILGLAMDAESAETREFWARLLVGASLHDSHDDLNLTLADLLSRLDLFHLRVLFAAWIQANQAPTSSHEAYCPVEKVQKLAGVAIGDRIEAIVTNLHEAGLLRKTAKPVLFGRFTQVNLSLRDLGLKFCQRCFGRLRENRWDLPFEEQYVPLDCNDSLSADVEGGLADSLAHQARAIWQSPS